MAECGNYARMVIASNGNGSFDIPREGGGGSFLGKKSDPERLKKYPAKVRYKVIGVEMKGVKSSMKLVALGATQRKG